MEWLYHSQETTKCYRKFEVFRKGFEQNGSDCGRQVIEKWKKPYDDLLNDGRSGSVQDPLDELPQRSLQDLLSS